MQVLGTLYLTLDWGGGVLLGGGEDREKGFILLVQFPLFANEVRRILICLKLCSISELAK